MSIEKGLYAAPQGLEAEPLEIEIEDPESVHIGIGGLEIDLEPSNDSEEEFNSNIAEFMAENELALLASDLISDYEDDLASRKDWIQTYVDGLDLLGLKIEDRTEPWSGACGVTHPLLAEALVKFQSETIMDTFPAAGPVRTKIYGNENRDKKERAQRVEDDMNFRITEEMPEFRPEHERMLWGMGLSGNGFKKVYHDPSLGRQTSIYVTADDVVVPYGTSSLKTAERVTHVMRKTENEIRKLQVDGFYRDIDLGEPSTTMDEVERKIAEKLGFRITTDNRYRIIEMQVDLDLPGYEDTDKHGEETGIKLPYIVTIDISSLEVLSIYRNWKESDKLKAKRTHFVHYGYIPGFGFYHLGLIHLVGAFAKSGTSILRQLVDAGTLSNLPGGLKSRGLRIKGDDTPISPGEFRDVDVPSGSIKDNILPLPYKEPSQVLAALLNQIIEDGRKFANAGDMSVSDMSAAAPVGTTFALLERSLKSMSAIQARIHYSMHEELRLIKDLICEYMPDEYEGMEGRKERPIATKEDYETVDVIPVSDPNAATMAQKIMQYQAALQLAQGAPQIYDLPLLHRQMLAVLGLKNANKLVPGEDDINPRDPISENQNVLIGKPVKAFLYQDHDSHIQVHMSMLHDPVMQQQIGQNPQGQTLMNALLAHINEHLGFKYRKQMEQLMGMQLPGNGEDEVDDDENEHIIPKDMEVQISQMAAKAAQQLLQQNQQQAAQQQAQQQMQDPIIQMQMQELQIKQQEVQRKIQKDQLDAAAKDKQMQIELERINAQKEIAGANMVMKHNQAMNTAEKMQETEGFRQTMQHAQQRENREHQSKQNASQMMERITTPKTPPQKVK